MAMLLHQPSPSPTAPSWGHVRLPCDEPCDVFWQGRRQEGSVWNISAVGLYAVLSGPLPAVGVRIEVRFCLPGERMPVVCEGRVRWRNEPSIFRGCGQTKPTLPPGCGIEFVVLDGRDLDRIKARVREWTRHTGG